MIRCCHEYASYVHPQQKQLADVWLAVRVVMKKTWVKCPSLEDLHEGILLFDSARSYQSGRQLILRMRRSLGCLALLVWSGKQVRLA